MGEGYPVCVGSMCILGHVQFWLRMHRLSDRIHEIGERTEERYTVFRERCIVTLHQYCQRERVYVRACLPARVRLASGRSGRAQAEDPILI